jgi:hypothetical protein
MDDQASLFTTEADQIVVVYPGEHTLEDNFRRFHSMNPHVYEMLVKLARRWKRRSPGGRCGIGMLFETARWYLNVVGVGEPMHLNNNYRAFYARLIMDQEPDLAGLFETRRQRFDDDSRETA